MRMIICSILTKLLLYSSSIFLHKPKDTEEVLVLPEVNLENHLKIYNILKGIVNTDVRANSFSPCDSTRSTSLPNK